MSLNYMGRYFQQKTNTPLEYPVSAPEGAPNYILKGAKAYFERAPSMLKGGRSTPRPPPLAARMVMHQQQSHLWLVIRKRAHML